MSSDRRTVIHLEGIGKKYRIRHQSVPHYATLRDVAGESLRNLGSRLLGHPHARRTSREDFWALREISLEVEQGERLGIIGRNGAGKSTLLKLIGRITAPSEGRILMNGRVGTLLEVGTGFHPELTGRENIFLNGAILGMRRSEIRRKFDEIVSFAEIEKFLDTPVKRYSSGMYVRLAFAVAAHLDPETLLIDEVLAVGDFDFQKKCLDKMNTVAESGRTIIFVSHNLEAISTLTNRCLVLHHGENVFLGPTRQGIQKYLGLTTLQERIFVAPGHSEHPRITRVEVRTSEPNGVHTFGMPLEIEVILSAPNPLDGGCLSFQILNSLQQPVTHIWIFDSHIPMARESGIFRLICHIPKCRLYMGKFSLTLHFSEKFGKKNKLMIPGICPFEVVMHGIYREFSWNPDSCQYLEDAQWKIEKINY